MNNNEWLAIVNPYSANSSTAKSWPYFLKQIKDSGIKIDYCLTKEPEEATDIVGKAVSAGKTKIIAVGGDGTINEIVNGLFADNALFNPDVELAILRQGTGSDFIRSLGIISKPPSFVELLKRDRIKYIDVGKISFVNYVGNPRERYFINACNIGIGADTVYKVNNRSKALGSKLTYFLGVMQTVIGYKNKLLSVTLDNEQVLEDKFCGIMVCNGRYIGGGMMIAPEASIDDGLFDIVVIRDISKPKLLTHLPLIYKGKHVNIKGIELYRGKEVFVSAEEKIYLEADGEVPGFCPVKFSIIPQILKVRI